MPEDTELNFKISGSVGRWSKGAVNQSDDVETVQNMLRIAAMILNDPELDPNALDGSISHTEQNSDTIKAIEAFQRRFTSAPDGLISVGKRTWQELMSTLEGADDEIPHTVDTGSNGSSFVTPGDAQFLFPFKRLPHENWTEGMRRFGASRSNGGRSHAGCDLYFDPGTVIHAITAGRVTLGPYKFYQGTFAMEVDHGLFLARYGEIQQSTFVRVGDNVTAGQPIAKVGDLTNINVSMLHLELYDKSAQGQLNVAKKHSAKAANGVPYMRRRDLIDPTSKLNVWQNNLS
jgi:murein DD-endopeptidase MepM/ murein hydrolase activator NlpD